MKISRFDARVLVVVLVLLAVAGGLVWFSSHAGMAKPEFKLAEGGQVGAFGPLVLEFRQPVTPGQVEAYLNLEPAVSGQWTWEQERATFRPERTFQVGQTYMLRLEAGATDETGRKLKTTAEWTFSIRSADIVYLGQATTRPELWLVDGTGKVVQPLTSTGGRVRDFAVFSGGEQVVYSAQNDQDGVDLWVVGRGGTNNRLLLACGADRCTQPSVAPDESAITFTRAGGRAPQGEIWTLDLVSGQSAALYPDQVISGMDPNWSPQGRYLQFYDPEYAQIRILDLTNNKIILVPTNQQGIGSWSPDGKRLLFTRAESSEIGLPFVRVYEVELETGDIRLLDSPDLGQVDSSLPIYSPDGTSLVIALRGLATSPNKQLWWFSLEDDASQAITADESASYAAYTWDPAGEWLAFQRLQLESSQSKPQVMVWQRASGSSIVLAEDAARPQWLP